MHIAVNTPNIASSGCKLMQWRSKCRANTKAGIGPAKKKKKKDPTFVFCAC